MIPCMDTHGNIERAHDVSCELDAHLSALARADSWRVEQRLKETEFETTDVVFFEGARGGELGPFVRKRINCSAGVGSAYEELMRAQHAGMRLLAVPHLVECTRVGDTLTVVMEYVSGPTLQHLVEERGGSLELAASLFPALCDAVASLHEGFTPPLIHRDLKPSNVIVRGGRPVIIDFGIARLWRADAEADTTHFVTRSYAPPEQFGFGQTDVRSDVYALGKLLLFCLTGQNPHDARNEEQYEALGVERPLACVIARATAFDPTDRYGGVREMKLAFERAVSGIVPAAGAADADTATVSAGALRATPDAQRALNDVPPFDWEYDPVGPDAQSSGAAVLHEEGAGRPKQSPKFIKNIVLIALYAVFVLGCIMAIVDPNEQDRGFPLWYLVMEYLSVAALVGSVVALLLNKPALAVWIPRLDMKRLRLASVIVLITSIVVFATAGQLAGAL